MRTEPKGRYICGQPPWLVALLLSQMLQAGGYAPSFTCGFKHGPQQCYLGGSGLSGYLDAGWTYNATELSNDWEERGTLSKILGRHTLSMGADLNYNTFQSPLEQLNVSFSSFQTSNLETSTVRPGAMVYEPLYPES